MAEILTPGSMMMGGGDGGLGFGSGGGLIGGLILGSLLRNGNGGLFGGDGNGAALGGAVLRNPPEQNQANPTSGIVCLPWTGHGGFRVGRRPN